LKLEQAAQQQQDKMTRAVRTCAEKKAKENAYKDARSAKEANAQLQG
jgi:ribosomal protein L20A (L18A)